MCYVVAAKFNLNQRTLGCEAPGFFGTFLVEFYSLIAGTPSKRPDGIDSVRGRMTPCSAQRPGFFYPIRLSEQP